jgi:hypothetical protein
MFLAKRSRPDILKEVVWYSTKCVHPNEEDLKGIRRVFMYVNTTKLLKLRISPDELAIYCYVDASYAIHHDAKSHTGIIISFGRNGGTIYAKSGKQKLVTQSSTEVELVACHEGIMMANYFTSILNELHLAIDTPTTVFQDNKSSILLVLNGSNSFKSKHINVRYFLTKEQLISHNIVIEYLNTNFMKADILTKALIGANFVRMRNWIMNIK